MLSQISEVGSTNEKQRMLRRVPEVQLVLKWAYNPEWNYYIRNLHLEGTGVLDLNEETFLLLRKLKARQFTGDSARWALLQHAHTLNAESCILLNRILQRDLRIGLNIKSINSVFPGLIPTFDVMLAMKVDWKKIRFPCWSSVKLDGVRGLYKNGKIYTRSGKELHGLDHITESVMSSVQLDGELLIPGMTFQESSGLIRNLNRTPDVKFHLFELPRADLVFTDRLRLIHEIANSSEHLRYVTHHIVNTREDAMDHYKACRSAGYEGTVLKPLDYNYVQKRSALWMKLKAIESADVKVTGYYPGTGKYKNMLGGLTVDYRGVAVDVGGGFSDEQRQQFWNSPPMGETIEILYQEETNDGSLRHPRFVRVRWDK